jgi:uncharacterized damage-inducible protein DinB
MSIINGVRQAMTRELFVPMFQYSNWANRRVLDLLSTIGRDIRRARTLLAHIIASEVIWMARLQGRGSSDLDAWPELPLDECARLMEQSNATYERFLEAVPPENFSLTIPHRNTKGQPFHTPLRDILSHVAMHGTHHRGQIAIVVRDSGFEPINIDLITFAREKEKCHD